MVEVQDRTKCPVQGGKQISEHLCRTFTNRLPDNRQFCQAVKCEDPNRVCPKCLGRNEAVIGNFYNSIDPETGDCLFDHIFREVPDVCRVMRDGLEANLSTLMPGITHVSELSEEMRGVLKSIVEHGQGRSAAKSEVAAERLVIRVSAEGPQDSPQKDEVADGTEKPINKDGIAEDKKEAVPMKKAESEKRRKRVHVSLKDLNRTIQAFIKSFDPEKSDPFAFIANVEAIRTAHPGMSDNAIGKLFKVTNPWLKKRLRLVNLKKGAALDVLQELMQDKDIPEKGFWKFIKKISGANETNQIQEIKKYVSKLPAAVGAAEKGEDKEEMLAPVAAKAPHSGTLTGLDALEKEYASARASIAAAVEVLATASRMSPGLKKSLLGDIPVEDVGAAMNFFV